MLNFGGAVFVWGPVADLDAAIRAYLKDTLGIDAPSAPWSGAPSLPYFLVDAFDLKALTMLGRPVLLAIDKRADRPGLATIRVQIDRIREGSGLPVLYATGTLASYERKRLIEQKVPFVVPGNQLYLPDLGVDLGEAVIVDVLPPPPDSRHSTGHFERGVEGLLESYSEVQRRTGNVVGYLGEWHSHPPGHSARQSPDDLLQLFKLALGMADDGLPVIQLIVGEHDLELYAGEVVA